MIYLLISQSINEYTSSEPEMLRIQTVNIADGTKIQNIKENWIFIIRIPYPSWQYIGVFCTANYWWQNRQYKEMDFLTCLFHFFRNNLVLRYIHTNHISHFFWWHYFFLELQNILKKERTEGAPVQNLPLFTTAIGKLKLNCKSFGSNHLILEMPHDNVAADLAVLLPFQSIQSIHMYP